MPQVCQGSHPDNSPTTVNIPDIYHSGLLTTVVNDWHSSEPVLDPMREAACLGRHWWPWAGTETDEPHLWVAAVKVCEKCPCRQPCALLALSMKGGSGTIWAGVRVLDWSGRGTPRNAQALGAVLVASPG